MTCAAALCLVAAYAVHDGDTLTREGPNVRLWGIDSPEMREPGGEAARAFLDALTAGQPLACRYEATDRYGRHVMQCWTPGGTDLACALVAAGHATDWPRYSGGYYERCEE
jgi:endonuclease YncB( thermonuclease family)